MCMRIEKMVTVVIPDPEGFFKTAWSNVFSSETSFTGVRGDGLHYGQYRLLNVTEIIERLILPTLIHIEPVNTIDSENQRAYTVHPAVAL